MKFGAFRSSLAPIGETYFQTFTNATLAAGSNYYTMGTFTMPCAGSLIVNLWAELNWPGTTWQEIWLAVVGVSPAVGSSGDMGYACDFPPGFNAAHELQTFAVWDNLAAGQVVSANARLNSTNAGAHLQYVGGLWRPMAA